MNYPKFIVSNQKEESKGLNKDWHLIWIDAHELNYQDLNLPLS